MDYVHRIYLLEYEHLSVYANFILFIPTGRILLSLFMCLVSQLIISDGVILLSTLGKKLVDSLAR